MTPSAPSKLATEIQARDGCHRVSIGPRRALFGILLSWEPVPIRVPIYLPFTTEAALSAPMVDYSKRNERRADTAKPLKDGGKKRLKLITCPHCAHQSVETKPADACQYYYDCKGCGAVLKPKSGDCCVFCSYGTVKCPPVQTQPGCHC